MSPEFPSPLEIAHRLAVPLVEMGEKQPQPTQREHLKYCPYCNLRLKGKQRVVCERERCRKIHHKRQASTQPSYRREARGTRPGCKKKGAQCKHCLNFDYEVRFANLTVCDSCAQQITRHGKCECGQLKAVRGRNGDPATCDSCEPPPHGIEILWQCMDGRLRRFYRSIRDGQVEIWKRKYTVKTNPLLLIVQPKIWTKVRR